MKAVTRNPTLGWYPDIPQEGLHGSAWKEALNVRYRNSAVERIRNSGQFGSQQFQWLEAQVAGASVANDDPVTGFGQLIESTSTEHTLVFTQHEMYRLTGLGASPWGYSANGSLNPYYTTGTIEVDAGTPTVVTGTSTDWQAGDNLPQPGDWIRFYDGVSAYSDWYQIRTVDSDTQLTLVSAAPAQAALTEYQLRLINGTTRTAPADAMVRGDRTAWNTLSWYDPTDQNINWLIASNGYNTAMKWNGGGQFEFVGGLDDIEGGSPSANPLNMRFRAMCVFHNILFVGDTSEDNGSDALVEFPSRLRWSNLNDFETWKVVFVGDAAGFSPVGEGADRIMALGILGSYMIIYKERHIYAAAYVGTDNGTVYITEITGTAGICSRRAWASNGQVHCFCDSENVYLLLPDLSIHPIGNPINLYWKERFNRTLSDNIQIQWRPDTNEFWITTTDEVGQTPATTEALILQLPDGTYTPATDNSLSIPVWSHVELPKCSALAQLAGRAYLTWDEVSESWDEIPTAWDDMYREVYGAYVFGDTEGRTWYLERDMGEGDVIERVGVLESRLYGDPFNPTKVFSGQCLTDSRNESVGWRIGLSEIPNGDGILWYGRDGFVNGALFHYLRNGRIEGFMRTGQYYAIRILMSADKELRVRVIGYQFEVQTYQGRHR